MTTQSKNEEMGQIVRKDILRKRHEGYTEFTVKTQKNAVAAMCQHQNSHLFRALMCTKGTLKMENDDVLIAERKILKRKINVLQRNC